MKDKIITCFFCSIFFGFLLINILSKDVSISTSERRKLAQFPDLQWDEVLDGETMEDFEVYTIDQFINRDQFRSMKNIIELKFFQKKDVHGLYVKEDAIYQRMDAINESSLLNITHKINDLANKFPEDSNLYFSVIPDKAYYQEVFQAFDYEELVMNMSNQLSKLSYIDIFSTLHKESYYRTDSHWKQEKIEQTARTLIETMQNSYEIIPGEWKTFTPFYGVYYGQLGLRMNADELRYKDSQYFDDVKVLDIEKNKYIDIYDEDKLSGFDPYEVFLSGAKPVLKIENPLAKNDRSLIIFRDSFASSLIPWMIPSYSSITIVDTRYVYPDALNDILDYQEQDVLFLYSTTLINQSNSMK